MPAIRRSPYRNGDTLDEVSFGSTVGVRRASLARQKYLNKRKESLQGGERAISAMYGRRPLRLKRPTSPHEASPSIASTCDRLRACDTLPRYALRLDSMRLGVSTRVAGRPPSVLRNDDSFFASAVFGCMILCRAFCVSEGRAQHDQAAVMISAPPSVLLPGSPGYSVLGADPAWRDESWCPSPSLR